jgi:hypothetical protein
MRSTLVVCLFVLVLLGSSSTPEKGQQASVQGSPGTTPVGRWKTWTTVRARSIQLRSESAQSHFGFPITCMAVRDFK